LLLQVKTKGTRKITFEQCLTALAAISEKKVGGCVWVWWGEWRVCVAATLAVHT
jgi:hypothetical protein